MLQGCAKQLAEIWLEEHRYCQGQQRLWFGNLRYLLRGWRSSGSSMLCAVLLSALDLVLFRVGRLLVPLNIPLYWWKNYSICICKFLSRRRIICFYSLNFTWRSLQNLLHAFIPATWSFVNKGLYIRNSPYFLTSVIFLCQHRKITFRWIVYVLCEWPQEELMGGSQLLQDGGEGNSRPALEERLKGKQMFFHLGFIKKYIKTLDRCEKRVEAQRISFCQRNHSHSSIMLVSGSELTWVTGSFP